MFHGSRYATPDEDLVRAFRKIKRQSPVHNPSGQLRRPSAQQLKPLRRAGRPSPSLWPQQTGLASATSLACQVDRSKADRAKQRRRRGGNHVCICQICGQRHQHPAAASEQLGRLESKWAAIRDHAVLNDAGFSGQALQALERQLDLIHHQMVVAHEGDAANPDSAESRPDSKVRLEQQPEPDPEATTTVDQKPVGPKDTKSVHGIYPAVNEPEFAAATQVEAKHQKVAGTIDPEKLIAAAEGGNPDDIRDLLEAGADFTVASEANGLAGIDRCLVLAAVGGHDAAVEVLLSAGADGTVTENGTSVLELVRQKYQATARSPPGSPTEGTAATSFGGTSTLTMAAHRDLLEGLQATERILLRANQRHNSEASRA